MAESLNLCLKAREIIVTRSHEELAIIVDHLFTRQESEEYKKARALFDFCVSGHLNCLTLKLLKVYQSSSNGVTRFRSIYLLSEALTDSRTRSFNFSLDPLYEIKRVLIDCLKMQETKESDIKIFRRIVYYIAYDAVVFYKDKWDELSDCILSLTNSKEPVKAFHIFIYLPLVYRRFIYNFMDVIVRRKLRSNCFILKTVNLLCGRERRIDVNFLIKYLLNVLMKSVKKLLYEMNEEFLVLGLEHFERFLSGDKILCSYNKEQCYVVKILMDNIWRSE